MAERNLLNAQLGAYDSGELKQHGLSYSGLLTGSYRVNPSTLAYATYSHGEKSGGFNLSIGSAPAAGANSLKVDPEKADNYEIGLKQNFLNNTLQLNSNIFWIDVSDYQTTSYEQVGNSVVSVLANAVKYAAEGLNSMQPINLFVALHLILMVLLTIPPIQNTKTRLLHPISAFQQA